MARSFGKGTAWVARMTGWTYWISCWAVIISYISSNHSPRFISEASLCDWLKSAQSASCFLYLGSTDGIFSQQHSGAWCLLVPCRRQFGQEVGERLLAAGDLHGRHSDWETSSGLFLPVLDHIEQPGDRRWSHTQALGGAVPTNHGVRLTCGGRVNSTIMWLFRIMSLCVWVAYHVFTQVSMPEAEDAAVRAIHHRLDDLCHRSWTHFSLEERSQRSLRALPLSQRLIHNNTHSTVFLTSFRSEMLEHLVYRSPLLTCQQQHGRYVTCCR